MARSKWKGKLRDFYDDGFDHGEDAFKDNFKVGHVDPNDEDSVGDEFAGWMEHYSQFADTVFYSGATDRQLDAWQDGAWDGWSATAEKRARR